MLIKFSSIFVSFLSPTFFKKIRKYNIVGTNKCFSLGNLKLFHSNAILFSLSKYHFCLLAWLLWTSFYPLDCSLPVGMLWRNSVKSSWRSPTIFCTNNWHFQCFKNIESVCCSYWGFASNFKTSFTFRSLNWHV